MTKDTQNPFNFEQALKELNDIVEKLEAGGIPLDDSLRFFEKGISLTRQCKEALTKAEKQVQILMEKNGNPTLEPYANVEEIA